MRNGIERNIALAKKEDNKKMRESNGLKLLVKFYENHLQLKMVSEKTGVSINKMQIWLDGELTQEKLSKNIAQAFHGRIEVS